MCLPYIILYVIICIANFLLICINFEVWNKVGRVQPHILCSLDKYLSCNVQQDSLNEAMHAFWGNGEEGRFQLDEIQNCLGLLVATSFIIKPLKTRFKENHNDIVCSTHNKRHQILKYNVLSSLFMSGFAETRNWKKNAVLEWRMMQYFNWVILTQWNHCTPWWGPYV